MTFGDSLSWGASKKECVKIYDAYRDRGGNFIDTANKYTDGTSEEIVGELIAPDRESIVLATKYSLSMNLQDPNASGNHKKNMRQSLEASLKRLKTDYIDLYWLHAWDYTTPVDEVMRSLDDMVKSGKILHIAISDAPAWIVSKANTMADLRGWTEFTALQLKYSLADRTIEREFTNMAKSFNLPIIAWSPLAMGILSGKYSIEDDKLTSTDGTKRFPPMAVSQLDEERMAIVKTVADVAREAGYTIPQVAIRWVMQKGAIPILGATKVEQIDENLGALDIRLSDSQMATLDEASAVELGFPHDFLDKQAVKEIIYGATTDKFKGFPFTA